MFVFSMELGYRLAWLCKIVVLLRGNLSILVFSSHVQVTLEDQLSTGE
jgi:hypothetical protein